MSLTPPKAPSRLPRQQVPPTPSPRETSYLYHLSVALAQPPSWSTSFPWSLWPIFAWRPRTSQSTQATPSWCPLLDPPSHAQRWTLELPTAPPSVCFSFLSALTRTALNTSFMLTTHFCIPSPFPDRSLPVPRVHVDVRWASWGVWTATWGHLCQRL